MTYGIDKEISDRAEVYANNPQALGFQYKKSGDVLDLIALKRIKDDLDKKRQEIALQYGQKAEQQKTVAEQTLDEVKTGIQRDVTEQTSKLLTQKKGRDDARLRKLAAGQRPNAPFGIPAAAQHRGAPNQQMMAGIGSIPPRSTVNPRGTGIAANRLQNTALAAKGGIVSFQNQGLVFPPTNTPQGPVSGQRQLKKYQKLSAASLAKLGYTLPEWSRLSDAEQQDVVKQYRIESSPSGSWDELIEGRKEENLREQAPPFGVRVSDEKLAEGDSSLLQRELGDQRRRATIQKAETGELDTFGDFTGVDTSGFRPRYPDVNILPPDAVAAAEEPVVSGAVPEAAPEAVDPFATIDRSILDPLTNVDLPTSTVEYQDPFGTAKGIQVVEDQEALQDWQASERARDSVAERTAAGLWADAQTDKAGIAALNQQQVAEMKRHYGDQAAQRKKDQWENLLAYGGGQGALSDIARGAWGMRHAGYGRDTSQLKGLQALQQYGQEQTTAAGKIAVEAGTEQMKMTEAARTEAGRSETQLLKQQGDQLSDTAKQYLEAGKANQTEQGKLRNDKVQLAIKNVEAAMKLSIADREYVISKEANDLRRLAITSQDMRTLMTGKVDVAQKLGDLGTKYQKMAADALTHNLTYQTMEDGPEKDKITAANQLFFHDSENIARAELEATGAMIDDKLKPMIAALPPESSASKFTNVRQTNPSNP